MNYQHHNHVWGKYITHWQLPNSLCFSHHCPFIFFKKTTYSPFLRKLPLVWRNSLCIVVLLFQCYDLEFSINLLQRFSRFLSETSSLPISWFFPVCLFVCMAIDLFCHWSSTMYSLSIKEHHGHLMWAGATNAKTWRSLTWGCHRNNIVTVKMVCGYPHIMKHE